MRRKLLVKTAGWIITAFGAVHVVVAPYDTRHTWRQVSAEGWWSTFTLDRAVTVDELRRSEAFWVTAGSFGVPLLALGCYILWSVHRNQRIPAWLGYLLLAYGVFAGFILPVSPIWAIAVAGLLIVLGDRRRRHEGHVKSGSTELPDMARPQ